jgi:hypothetical protein
MQIPLSGCGANSARHNCGHGGLNHMGMLGRAMPIALILSAVNQGRLRPMQT